jgi:type III pantothenate kinase
MAPTPAPLLTLDLGNTRAKLRWWSDARTPTPIGVLDLAAGDAASPELSEALGRWPPARTALSSVASRATTGAWRARLAEAGRVPLEEPLGIINGCRSPERVGRDRLFAGLGAVRRTGVSCVVVDAGTALTVDAVEVGSAGPVFLGGAIAPGPELLAGALASGTAGLPRVEARVGAPALGRVTEEALQAGITVGFRGAAAELTRSVASEAGLAGAPVVVTGGARALLLEPVPWLAGEHLVVPDLVHLGLLAALEASCGTP